MRIVKSGSAGLAFSPISYVDANGNLVFGGSTASATTLFWIGRTASANRMEINNGNAGGALDFTFGGTRALEIGNVSGVNGITNIANRATAGNFGVAAVFVEPTPLLAQVAAVANFINYTPPAATGRYRISWVVDVQSNTTDSFSVTATWKDAGGTARTQPIGGWSPTGSALTTGLITNAIGIGVYYGSALIAIDNSATAITVSTVGTFTTVSYDLAAVLEGL